MARAVLVDLLRRAAAISAIARETGESLDEAIGRDVALRTSIDLVLLAAARAEALLEGKDALKVAEQLRADWSDTLATFLNG